MMSASTREKRLFSNFCSSMLTIGASSLAVEQQHAVAFVLRSLDIRILFLLVVGIEVDEFSVFISLVVFDKRLVLVECEVLTVDILEEGEVLGTVVEVLLREHAVVDEQLEVVPFLLIVLTVVFEGLLQTVGHLLCDVGGNLLYVSVTLQVRTAHIQRNIG